MTHATSLVLSTKSTESWNSIIVWKKFALLYLACIIVFSVSIYMWFEVCWFSTLLREDSLRVLRFSPPQKPTFSSSSSIWIIVKQFILSLWLACWSSFDKSSNSNQSAHDSQTALGVHSFRSVSQNEIYVAFECCFFIVFSTTFMSFHLLRILRYSMPVLRHRIY